MKKGRNRGGLCPNGDLFLVFGRGGCLFLMENNRKAKGNDRTSDGEEHEDVVQGAVDDDGADSVRRVAVYDRGSAAVIEGGITQIAIHKRGRISSGGDLKGTGTVRKRVSVKGAIGKRCGRRHAWDSATVDRGDIVCKNGV